MNNFQEEALQEIADFGQLQDRESVGLTDEEFKKIMWHLYQIYLKEAPHDSDDHLLWNAIEAKLKEKNK